MNGLWNLPFWYRLTPHSSLRCWENFGYDKCQEVKIKKKRIEDVNLSKNKESPTPYMVCWLRDHRRRNILSFFNEILSFLMIHHLNILSICLDSYLFFFGPGETWPHFFTTEGQFKILLSLGGRIFLLLWQCMVRVTMFRYQDFLYLVSVYSSFESLLVIGNGYTKCSYANFNSVTIAIKQ